MNSEFYHIIRKTSWSHYYIWHHSNVDSTASIASASIRRQ